MKDTLIIIDKLIYYVVRFLCKKNLIYSKLKIILEILI